MKFQVVLRWPASSVNDFDGMGEIEDLLVEKLGEQVEVDGHDFGPEETNISSTQMTRVAPLKKYGPFSESTGRGLKLESPTGRSMELNTACSGLCPFGVR